MGALAEYVDNFISFALEPDRAHHLRDLGVGRLRDAGWTVYELSDVKKDATILGWDSSGDRVSATPRRLWRLRTGTLTVLE
jgi:hypothetical protein